MSQNKCPFSRRELEPALLHLSGDRILAPVVAALPTPKPGRRRDPFHALIVAILNQQISRSVANVIEQRLAAKTSMPFTPEAISSVGLKSLRAAGLSKTKAICAKDCAKYALANELSARSCRGKTDEQIMDELVAIKGIGAWSAHMVLIFGLGRMDIMPDGDGGIQRAAARLFGVTKLADGRSRLLRAAPSWKPYRSLAAWYLWRSLG